MESEGLKKSERFSTGGMVGGVCGILVVVTVLVLGTADSSGEFPAWAYPAGAFVAVAIWAILLRPCLVLGPKDVELRNIFHSRWVPYALITDVNIELVTTIRTESGEYVASGFGRTRRKMRRDERGLVEERPKDPSLGWLVEAKLKRRVDDAKYALGEVGEVRLARAWPEIVAMAVTAVATLVTVLLT